MKRNMELAWRPGSDADIKAKRVVIIGGTGGIGRALSRELAARGAHVTVVGRTFRDGGQAGIDFLQADLSLMREASRIAALLPAETLDLLVFTTGIFAAPQREETAEGIERDLAISYLSRRTILEGVAPRLGVTQATPGAKPRVFVMGYPGTGAAGIAEDLNAEHSYKAMPVHMNTVAGNEMLVLDAARRYRDARFFGLNPGLIKTNIRDNFFGKNSFKSRLAESLIGLFTPTAATYTRRIVPLLFSPDLDMHSGAMFNSKAQAIYPSAGLTDEHIHQFMAASEQLIARATRAAITN